MDAELRRLRRRLETMAADERHVFEAIRFRGLGYRAIADELGLTAEQVESLFARALLHLFSH